MALSVKVNCTRPCTKIATFFLEITFMRICNVCVCPRGHVYVDVIYRRGSNDEMHC